MTDDSRVRDDSAVDASAFLDWLDEMAAAEGKSREELMQTLVSSYWTLDEMFRLMEQADPDAELPALGLPEELDEAGQRPGPRGKPTGNDLAERVDDLADGLETLRGEVEARPAEPVDGALHERVDALAERVESLEATLADQRQTSPAVDDELDALDEDLETVEAALRTEHDELRDRVDTEFGHLHAILEHLVETADGLEGRTERLESRLEGDLQTLLSSRERLVRLKRTAAQVGASRAKCGYCGTKVDVALLPTPECPQCDRPFRDVEPKRGWFGSATLVVEEQPATGRSKPDSTVRDGGGGPDVGRSPGADNGRDGGGGDGAGWATGFEWIGEDE